MVKAALLCELWNHSALGLPGEDLDAILVTVVPELSRSVLHNCNRYTLSEKSSLKLWYHHCTWSGRHPGTLFDRDVVLTSIVYQIVTYLRILTVLLICAHDILNVLFWLLQYSSFIFRVAHTECTIGWWLMEFWSMSLVLSWFFKSYNNLHQTINKLQPLGVIGVVVYVNWSPKMLTVLIT